VLSSSVYLAALRRDCEVFAELLGSQRWGSEVPGCPDWSVGDLTRHLSGVHRWAHGVLVTGQSGDEPEGPADSPELTIWFTEGAQQLCDQLARTDPQAPIWTFGPKPRVAQFWFRRQALETFVHLWDLQQAMSLPLSVDTELALDGVDEVVSMMFPRQVRLDRTDPLGASMRILVSDQPEASYLLTGDGTDADDRAEADVTVRGSAADLLLVLWGRMPVDKLDVEGDVVVAERIVAAAITP
jgi:uncharacterized protein (TIGR03083 family)